MLMTNEKLNLETVTHFLIFVLFCDFNSSFLGSQAYHWVRLVIWLTAAFKTNKTNDRTYHNNNNKRHKTSPVVGQKGLCLQFKVYLLKF